MARAWDLMSSTGIACFTSTMVVPKTRVTQQSSRTHRPRGNKPVHIAGVFDGRRLSLYVDGKLQGRDSFRGSPLSNSVSFYDGGQVQPDEIKGTFAPGSIEIRVSVDIRFAIE
jgi:hypothetical protein